ncbi:MAG TPA: YifB family Mg chelatase-like AAA ATPase [Coriobacteriia bacterium]
MTQAVVGTFALSGVEALPVEVQADVGPGLPTFAIVGLGDAAVLEARDRVRAAVRASGFEFPSARIVVNLAPAPLRKHGTAFDLPIALAILAATGQVSALALAGVRAVGELALDGRLRPVPGALAHAVCAVTRKEAIVGPADTVCATAVVPGLVYHAARHLGAFRTGLPDVRCSRPLEVVSSPRSPDLSEVAGQDSAKRALEIAAAGGHNLLFVGPPGAGKTMLARRLPGILPPLDPAEALDTAVVHSVAGLDETSVLRGARPFRSPHHTTGAAGLVGGGTPPLPGEASLAHNGVLFLDELAEFGPAALQALRQPMEDGVIRLVRAEGRVVYPARFALVAAMNPCPCGFLGDTPARCTCTDAVIARYARRVGGPLMDRIDLCLRVDRIDPEALLGARVGESSAAVRERVVAARGFAWARGGPSCGLSGRHLLETCSMSRAARKAIADCSRAYQLSGRGVTRLLRVARTVADLSSSGAVAEEHVLEAAAYRSAL